MKRPVVEKISNKEAMERVSDYKLEVVNQLININSNEELVKLKKVGFGDYTQNNSRI